MAKPEYTIPSMAEVRATKPNGFTSVSTFSGCGGSCLGLRMAGFNVVWASEFVEAARECYQANHDTPVDGRDIREVAPQEILDKIGLDVGDLDLLEGSPPCAAFSSSGIREKGWGKVKKYSAKAQRVDDLFFEFVRLLRGLRPRMFVAENVYGLVTGSSKGYFLRILAAMREAGYNVECRLLDARWLGVPQTRRRLFFIGACNDLNLTIKFPDPKPYQYTLLEAVPWIRDKTYKADPAASMSRFAIGKRWREINLGRSPVGKLFNLVRPQIDKPCPCVVAKSSDTSAASVAHPFECRKFDIKELKRICSFPEDFVTTGTYAQQAERLGRAVPPLMMREIALKLRESLDESS